MGARGRSSPKCHTHCVTADWFRLINSYLITDASDEKIFEDFSVRNIANYLFRRFSRTWQHKETPNTVLERVNFVDSHLRVFICSVSAFIEFVSRTLKPQNVLVFPTPWHHSLLLQSLGLSWREDVWHEEAKRNWEIQKKSLNLCNWNVVHFCLFSSGITSVQ